MVQVNMHEAKSQLSRLVERAERGEEVLIARAGRVVVRLVPVAEPTASRRPLGLLAGQIHMTPDFDDPLPDEILAELEGEN